MIIRLITPDDINELVHIHAQSRRASEQGIIRDTDLDRDSINDYTSLWNNWMQDDEIFKLCAINDDGDITGFCLYGRVKTRPAFDRGVVPKFGAEIYAIYVHPDHFREKIGLTLFKATINDLITKKHSGLILWALKKNKRACGFYENLGAERIGKQRVDIGQSSWAEETCFAWKDVRSIT